MAILKILIDDNPILRRKAQEAPKPNKRLRKLASDMLETMYEADGVGLAAPQIGVSERLIVVDIGQGPLILLNPRILSHEGTAIDDEGCLSLPGRRGYVTRFQTISVTGINLNNRKVSLTATDLLARVIQHEIDHLDGILFIDYAKKPENEDSSA
ncbi:MAG: peptide deformylase [Firmicutes bacterium]|nr:peptide deformylase [Bacillota bacterium]